MLTNYPKQWGFLCKPSEMIGKTITDAEVARMEYGSVSDNCILLRFNDGSRGFLLGRSGDVMVGPDLKVYETSRFFTPEEYGEVVADQKRMKEQRDAAIRKDKEKQLAQLQKELSE